MIKFDLEVSKTGMCKMLDERSNLKLNFCTPNNDGQLFNAVMGLLKEGGRITIEIKQLEKEKEI